MKLGLGRSEAIAVGFTVISLSSAVYISVIAINYLAYFPALAQIDSRVTNVAFLDGSDGPRFSTKVTVENPGDYSGFTVGDLSLKVFLEHGNASAIGSFNETLFADQPLTGVLRVNTDLAPRSQTVISIILSLNQQESAAFSSFDQKYHGNIFVHSFLTVDVITFLFAATGATVLNPVQDLPLS